MTTAFLVGLMLLAFSANSLAQNLDPDAITKSVARCPAARAAFAKLGALKEPAETADKSLWVIDRCSYIEKLRSDGNAYMEALHSCAARGLHGLNDEVRRVEALISALPETPQLCHRVDG